MKKRNIEVCFSPALFSEYRNPEAIVVILQQPADVLSAPVPGIAHAGGQGEY